MVVTGLNDTIRLSGGDKKLGQSRPFATIAELEVRLHPLDTGTANS
jgi:hypothetical protein